MEELKKWIEGIAYCRALGLRLEKHDESTVCLFLPFDHRNSNPGGALHGGCAATLGVVGAQSVARVSLGEGRGPWRCSQTQVMYLSAAVANDVVAEARLLRRGKTLCFVEVDIRSTDGKQIARTIATVEGLSGATGAASYDISRDDESSDAGPIAQYIEEQPFISERGIRIENMRNGRSRLLMPWKEANGAGNGLVHEGAVLALLDTTGAMASWAETGPGPKKAATVSLQSQILGAAEGDLVAYGHCVHRDGEMLWSDAEIARCSDNQVVARGTVFYRLAM